jgi:YesN/AraC family two-component response regulator
LRDLKILKEITSNLSILYAEDEESVRRGMQKTLERLFKNVYVAKDGYEGIELFKSHKVDLVMSDINMPNINGVEMFEAIIALEEFPPPFITLTAHNESELLLQLINLGIDKFLLKPVDRDKMIDALYKVCSAINDKLLIEQYHKDIEEAYEESEKQKRILENKLKHIAIDKNIQQAQIQPKKTSEQEQIKEEKKQTHFEMLDNEDSDELEDLCAEMDTYVEMMFKCEDMDEKYIFNFTDAIQKYGSILNMYPLFMELVVPMRILSEEITENIDTVKQNQIQLAEYFESLHFTLENFRVKVWGKEVDDPTFFNNSFISDINLIIMAVSGSDSNDDGGIEFF